MLGPISGGTRGPFDIPTAMLFEAVGAVFLVMGVLGDFRPRSAYTTWASRATGRLVFLIVASVFVWTSVRDLHRDDADGTAVFVFLVAVVASLVFYFVGWQKYRGWRSWPLVDGIVEAVDVREVRTRSAHYFAAEAAYSYVVNGEYFSGRYSEDFSDEATAYAFAETMKGSKVRIRYNAAKPELSRRDV